MDSETFSGGRCTACNVTIDPLRGLGFISIAHPDSMNPGNLAALQSVNLAAAFSGATTGVFGTPVSLNAVGSAEAIAADPLQQLVLSPSEVGPGGNPEAPANDSVYQLLDYSTSSPTVLNFSNLAFPSGLTSLELDAAALDCATGVALSSVEDLSSGGQPPQLLLINTKNVRQRSDFNNPAGTWTAPSNFVSLAAATTFDIGTGPLAIAPVPSSAPPTVPHLGIASGEFGGNTFVVFSLPIPKNSAVNGTAADLVLGDYVVVTMPTDITDSPPTAWAMGRDPHTITAYLSPNQLIPGTTVGVEYAVLQNDITPQRTKLAIVDMAALLNLTGTTNRQADGHTLIASKVSSCNINVNPGCSAMIRFVNQNPQ
jgi:hypothetical protein